MRPQLLKVPLKSERSFSIRQDTVPFFYNRWHYHPEVELVHIEAGSGTQFVGNNIRNFASGEVLLIGSNLPHYWQCDSDYFSTQHNRFAQATVVHFLANFWGDTFLLLPENRAIAQLLEKAQQGIRLFGEAREQAKQLLADMLFASESNEMGTNRIIALIRVLAMLAQSDEIELLSTASYPIQFDEIDDDRINRIYAHSTANYQRKISLDEIAAVANMNPNSFCRYFKSRTGKSYSWFLIELRVNLACKLLIEGRLSIAQVCYESGFNQFSGFNKYFKLITGKSPIQYQRAFSKVLQ
ncbi:helix-turn-helix domain-containing protein [Spirosoma sp. SC4-14]|uniref:AraC family transcriptional regulator n=1 Tax=Spirosoma sp. SC4-14 TaxID=3128900 RepID=UPI0030D2A86C